MYTLFLLIVRQYNVLVVSQLHVCSPGITYMSESANKPHYEYPPIIQVTAANRCAVWSFSHKSISVLEILQICSKKLFAHVTDIYNMKYVVKQTIKTWWNKMVIFRSNRFKVKDESCVQGYLSCSWNHSEFTVTEFYFIEQGTCQ